MQLVQNLSINIINIMLSPDCPIIVLRARKILASHNTTTGTYNNNTISSVNNVVLISGSLREFTWFMRWMQTDCQMSANPQTNPTDLGCESTCRLLLSHTVYIYNYYSARSLVLTLPSQRGWEAEL